MVNAIAWSAFWLGIAALLGFFIAWFMRGNAFGKTEAELADLRERLRGSDAALKKSENQLRDKDNQIKSINSKVDKSKEEISTLKTQLSDSENIGRSLKSDLSLRESELSGLKDIELKFNELLPKFEHNTSIAKELEAELSTIGTDRDSWKSKYENSHKEIEAFRLDNEDMVNKFTSVKENLDSANAEIERLKRKVDQAENAASNEVDRYKETIESQKEEIKTLKVRILELESELENVKSSLTKLSEGSDDFEKVKSDLIAKHDALQAELNDLKGKVDIAESGKSDAVKEASDFKAKWDDLQMANGKMLQEIETLKAQLANSSSDKGALEALQAELDKAKSDCNGKCADLEAEIAKLKGELEAAAQAEPEAKSDDNLFAESYELEVMPSAEEVTAAVGRVKEKAEQINKARIGDKDSMASDDLKRIKGIGEFTETKLHAAGINSFRQIANFTEEDEDTVEETIEFFPGRVRRYDWVGQAKEILGIKLSKQEEELSRMKRRAGAIDFDIIGYATSKDKDDLKKIKGIGPFIEQKLNALGIFKFRQVSKFTENIDDIVNKAIEFFPGRIKRDDWKGQAKVLADEKES